VVVTGCWAQTSPADVAALGGVDLVVGNADKARLPDLLAVLIAAAPAAARSEVERHRRRARSSPVRRRAAIEGRARAFVKVQDGCQHRCAFCIVPFARGASRS
jgi:threonylcarbamoyladenosine tRNA methylthiotransferase MtaB